MFKLLFHMCCEPTSKLFIHKLQLREIHLQLNISLIIVRLFNIAIIVTFSEVHLLQN